MTYKPVYLEIPVGEDGFAKGGRMSLRDYFAARALPAVIAMATEATKQGMSAAEAPPNAIAKAAYNYADCMLAERDK